MTEFPNITTTLQSSASCAIAEHCFKLLLFLFLLLCEIIVLSCFKLLLFFFVLFFFRHRKRKQIFHQFFNSSRPLFFKKRCTPNFFLQLSFLGVKCKLIHIILLVLLSSSSSSSSLLLLLLLLLRVR